MRWRSSCAVVAAALVIASCGGDSEPVADIKLDGSPRPPDVAGVVEAVSVESITIDGEQRDLSRKLLSFSTYTLTAVPVRGAEGAFVHAGVEDDKVVWVAVVARTLPGEGGAKQAFYNGTLARTEGRRLVFTDGTVLPAAPAVPLPAAGASVIAEINVDTDEVTSIRGA